MSIAAFQDAAAELGNGKFELGDITAPAAAGLGVLGAIADPAGWLVGLALGPLLDFLMANCALLREPMDFLVGDVGQIMGHAQKWMDLSASIVSVGNAHAAAVADLPSWDSPAAGHYLEIQRALNDAFAQSAEAAAQVSASIEIAGQVCAGVREFIWGMIKDLLSSAIGNALVALASALITCGGSLGAFVAWFQGKIAVVMSKISKKIAELFEFLAKITKKWTKLSEALGNAARYFRAVQRSNIGRSGGFSTSAARQSDGSLRVSNPTPDLSPLPEGVQGPASTAGTAGGAANTADDAGTVDHHGTSVTDI
ncbi:hypothetical protein ACQB6R_02280 [Propionibacteriaceae bacterium G1746]|uniref:hypothetical protein n=1 Tax=Aestuariimicrobium sp. G57 TaxID=3418485 RepID=UPI003C1A9DA2